MSVGATFIDFEMEQINGGPMPILPGHAAAADGWQAPDSAAIDAAADEWSRQQQTEPYMESGSELAALDCAVAAEWDRLLSQLPVGGDACISREHYWFTRDKRSSRWVVVVWTGQAGRPGVIRGSGSNDDSLSAAGDAALADLRTNINAAVAVGAAAADLLKLAPVAVVAAETRAA